MSLFFLPCLLSGFADVGTISPRELIPGEIGHVDGFTFYTDTTTVSFSYAQQPPRKPKQIVHGPQKVGKRGKPRRW